MTVTGTFFLEKEKIKFLFAMKEFGEKNIYLEHRDRMFDLRYLINIFKTENYFLSLSLNKREDIKKINLGTVKEQQEYLDTFKNALIDGYFYYKNNYDKYIEDSVINKDLNDIINILTENFDLDEIFI